MDLLTVTCHRDRKLLPLQSQSINLFVKIPTNHYVVLDSHDQDPQDWYNYLKPYYHTHNLIVLPCPLPNEDWIYHPEICKNNVGVHAGWLRQQAIKILVSTQIKSSRYVVIDSDCIFIKNENFSDWPEQGNYTPTSFIVSESMDWLQRIAKFYRREYLGEIYESYVPFVMKTETAKEISSTLNFKEFFFNITPYVSEFLLYGWFVGSKGEKIESGRSLLFHLRSGDLYTHPLEYYNQIYNGQSFMSIEWHLMFPFLTKSQVQGFLSWLTDRGLDKDLIDLCFSLRS